MSCMQVSHCLGMKNVGLSTFQQGYTWQLTIVIQLVMHLIYGNSFDNVFTSITYISQLLFMQVTVIVHQITKFKQPSNWYLFIR